ncbi:energy transducer TonB [Pseudomonas thivervalensis]|uniref:energy transducer TonB n=1 Tax=Pseudomonas thivervalensis TaxID=86265 RepID=UPI00069CF068|nr:energy transducer TonB [Pseudomonas thivervalensis]OAB51989.1 energy transducer TonB [Pseudomonas thivervalensis]SDG78301.1 TonB family C-terminal domain-containing protein [Pseudomonas thivervalensis]
MRWSVVMLLLCLAGTSGAAEMLLVPEHNPRPDYPTALVHKGIMGMARVGFMVHADGRVDEVTILHSDHPDFAEAAREAVSQWRFKPWPVDLEHPAKTHVVAPFEFRLDDLPLDANKWIKTWKCSDINAHANGQLWVQDLLPFHYTRLYLSNVFFVKQLPETERLALIARFNRLLPLIVQRCGGFPAARYMRMLPKEVRELL